MLTPALQLVAFAVTAAVFSTPTMADETDYDADYYPGSNYELELIADEVAAGIPPSFDHVDDGPPSPYHYDGPSPDQDDLPPSTHDDAPANDEDGEVVKDKWEHDYGDVVEGGYTVQEPDGTVHHVRYTESKNRMRDRHASGAEGKGEDVE